jgi:hypothetical protein
MKTLILFAFSILLGTAGMTQDSWKVKLQNKVLLSTGEESEEKNVVRLKMASVPKKGVLVVQYQDGEKRKGWERSLMVFNGDDGELLRRKGSVLSLGKATLASLFRKTKTLELFTIAMPTDPDVAATIRVRRIHLCTLVLE